VIRVDAIDTYEQVTDFASAADHTQTLRKWEELGVRMTTPPRKSRSALGFTDVGARGQRSVFNDKIDSTALRDTSDEALDARWRFDGPWIAGLTDGEFATYVTKQVRKQKPEFIKILRRACADAITKDNQRKATEEGKEAAQPVQASDISEEQFSRYMKTLRHDRVELYRHIRKFLDLPPAPNSLLPAGNDWLSVLDGTRESPTDIKDVQPMSDSPYADLGPPKTHPSAGLSYGRSSAYTFNHPQYGPQAKPPPVQARVVMPKGAATGNFAPVLGVGGFVVDVPSGENSFNLRSSGSRQAGNAIPGLVNIEPDKVGGSKGYVRPRSASVDAKGRVVLKVDQADNEAIAVLEGKMVELYRQEIMYTKGLGSKPLAFRSLRGYGLSSEDLGG
jgi:Mitochondrial ribosomal protein subunit